MRLNSSLPLGALAAAIVLFVVAGQHYPGGSPDDPAAIGFSWTHNYLSALFRAQAINGAPNGGRPWAIAGLACWCASQALLFWRMSRRVAPRRVAKALEIGGVGGAVYTLLVATPMHDLMVTVGLAFNAVALGGLALVQWRARAWGLVAAGAGALAVLGAAAVTYYTGVGLAWLAILQKVSGLAGIAWIVACDARLARGPTVAPAAALDAAAVR